jgi:hypothetical protein
MLEQTDKLKETVDWLGRRINESLGKCGCGGNYGQVGDCWRCLECESLPVKKDPFQD